MDKEHYFIYPKDKNGDRTGHTICVLVKEGRMFHGTALCSNDDQFQYSLGRELALQRALDAYVRHTNRVKNSVSIPVVLKKQEVEGVS